MVGTPYLPLGEGAPVRTLGRMRVGEHDHTALPYRWCFKTLISLRFAQPAVPTLFVPAGHFPLIGGIDPQGKPFCGNVHKKFTNIFDRADGKSARVFLELENTGN